jgi:hypothetical protein
VAQSFHQYPDRLLPLFFRADPAQSNAERDKVGTQAGLSLRPDPPSRSIVAAAPLRVGGRKRGLCDPAQTMQRRDDDVAFVALAPPTGGADKGFPRLAAPLA